MDHLKFVIEASEAETMAQNLGLKSVLNLLPIIVRSAQKLARPPISHFPVAAAGLTADGRIFVGVNIEFPNLPLHHSIHAEQFLITNLSLHPKTHLSNVVVSAYPCGHCRQFLQEIRGAPDIQILVLQNHEHGDEKIGQINGYPDDRNVSFRPLSYFLPHRFGPDDLLEKDVPLILEKQENCLILTSEMNGKTGDLCNGFSAFEEGELLMAALEAANGSHAPYSKCPSGVAMIDVDGNVYKGSYMESAAYNPSLGPAQAGIIAFLAAHGGGGGGGGYERIVGTVLVEKEGAVVKQEETVRLFLKAVSPKCEFHVFHCKSGSSSLGKME